MTLTRLAFFNHLLVGITVQVFIASHVLCYPLIPEFGCALHTDSITVAVLSLIALPFRMRKGLLFGVWAGFAASRLWWCAATLISLGWPYAVRQLVRI